MNKYSLLLFFSIVWLLNSCSKTIDTRSTTNYTTPSTNVRNTLPAATPYSGLSSTTNTGNLTYDSITYVTPSIYPITIGNVPIVVTNFFIVASSTLPCKNITEVFTFYAKGSGIPDGATYEWYFGDSANVPAVIGNPVTHSFYTWPNPNIYTIQVKLKYNNQIILEAKKNIQAYGANANITPVPDFTYAVPDSINKPNYFTFTNATTNNSTITTYYLWRFGDAPDSFASKDATHTFPKTPAYGIYPVTLITKNVLGCRDSVTKSVTIGKAPVISGCFSSYRPLPCATNADNIMFKPAASNVPSGCTYNWTFGDGGIGIGDSILHAFASVQSYPVSLTISKAGSTLYSCSTNVSAYGASANPTVAFTLASTDQSNQVIYTFNNSTSWQNGNISGYLWDFGDATPTSTQTSPTHNYTKKTTAKTYQVTLTATAPSGCSASTVNQIFIPSL